MLLVREVFHCTPAKVKPLVKMFLEMSKKDYHDLVDHGHREIHKIEA